jgi:hypothetical protein
VKGAAGNVFRAALLQLDMLPDHLGNVDAGAEVAGVYSIWHIILASWVDLATPASAPISSI